MTERQKKNLYKSCAVAALIAVALVCRIVSRETDDELPAKILNNVRSLIYLGLLSVWGVSFYRRISQVQAKKFFVIVSAFMIFWILLRAFKFYFVREETALRYLWYAYYIPMLLIPTFTLFIAMSIGKHVEYKLPGYVFLLLIPAFTLIMLVMTNDLHQFVFHFPSSVFSEKEYSYGIGYILAAGWSVACGLVSLVLMFAKSKLPKTKFSLWIPIVPFAVIVICAVLYALRVPFIWKISRDLAVFECLAFSIFLESCLSSGLIRSNTRYEELFRASKDLSVQITDENFETKYASASAEPIDKDLLLEAEESPVFLGEKRLRVMPIRGGKAVWTEDISELLAAKDDLETIREELKDRNDFLQYSYKREEENKIVEEQNRLYDLLQTKTQKQMNAIERLTKEYGVAKSKEEKTRILSKIVFHGSFIKRRKDFVLTADSARKPTANALQSAFAESFRALALLGIKGAHSVKEENADVDLLTQAYDFFEETTELALDKAKYVFVRVFGKDGEQRITLLFDCELPKQAVLNNYPNAVINEDDGETSVTLTLKGGNG